MRRLLTLTLIATVMGCSSDSATGPDRPITSVTLAPSTQAMLVGQSIQLVPTIVGGFSRPTVTWVSSNVNVATVTDSGVVSARAAGSATISASTGGVTGTAAITVTAGSVTITPATNALVIGQSTTLTAAVVSGLTNPTVVWSSSNANIASVDAAGKVTAKAVGSATISANAGGSAGSAAITVTSGGVDHLTVCDGANLGSCNNAVTLGALGTSATARATAFNALGADISATCTFAWAPSANVVSIAFFGDATKRDALITRTGFGVISIIVTCGGVPAVFTINGPAVAP